MQLRRESAANLLEKLLDCRLRLLGSIRGPVPGYSLSRDVVSSGIVHGEDDDPIVVDRPRVCSKNRSEERRIGKEC